jgi:glycerol-3-phosphate acyltransferase PlsX
MTLKRLPGVRRPGIAVPMPAHNAHGVCLLIDAGANPACRPHHLHQYAIMGANYYREIFEEESPRVSLVSIGEEETKGTNLTKEAAKLLRGSALNFVGNMEGRDLFGGACEVAVADGFVGNIILKSAEGFAEMLLGMIHEVLAGSSPEALRDIARRMDYAEFGGAPLLGVDGIVMICHGRSDRRAIANAIRACTRAVAHNLNENIVRGLTSEGANA